MEIVGSEEIARLNDEFRGSRQGMMLTPGVQCLVGLPELLDAVIKFNEFTEDNDPYGEHDFGSLDWRGEKVLWKIDYYDESMSGWMDPLSPRCRRVLTVMLAREY